MTDDKFEHLSAAFVISIARTLPENSDIVFSSTLCARNPDACFLWHSGYRQKHRAKLLLRLFFSASAAFARGIAKIVMRYEPFGYALYGKIGESILVVNAVCGAPAGDGSYKTSYVSTGKDDAIFVFGRADKCGSRARKADAISAGRKMSLTFRLAKSGVNAFIKLEGDGLDKTLLLLEWLTWVLGLQWLGNYYLALALSETITSYNIKKIGCIHEMHSYARIVWQAASKFGLESFTVQHASISPGKRWYFPAAEEKASGLALPGVFYVFDERAQGLLAPSFGQTRFLPGRSCRYSYLTGISPTRPDKSGYCLFVTGIAGFDNETVLNALKIFLTGSVGDIRVRLRLHTHAQLDSRMRSWVKSESKKNRIELSAGTDLLKDIEGSRVVIGSSSTVIEEALLCGRPVIQVTHPDYLQYIDVDGVTGAKRIDYREMSEEQLYLDDFTVDTLAMRKRLGLDQPAVDFNRLFS